MDTLADNAASGESQAARREAVVESPGTKLEIARSTLDRFALLALAVAAAMLGAVDFVEGEIARGFFLGAFCLTLSGATAIFGFALKCSATRRADD